MKNTVKNTIEKTAPPVTTGLAVPIKVYGFCVGTEDAANNTSSFSGTTTDFSNIPWTGGESGPYVSSADTGVLRPLASAPLNPLPAGIHLHWILPYALANAIITYSFSSQSITTLKNVKCSSKILSVIQTLEGTTYTSEKSLGTALNAAWSNAGHSSSLQNDLPMIMGAVNKKTQFPAVPNRWLVTRMSQKKATSSIKTKSWIIESDALSKTPPSSGHANVTMGKPTSSASEQPYRYLGATHDATNWQEPCPTGSSPIKIATGNELNALTTGEPNFSGFYPNCMQVFGHYDDCTGLEEGEEISYTVVGWYSQSVNDPLTNGLSLEKLHEEYGWTCNMQDTLPTYSLYRGSVQNIKWNASTSYITAPDPLALDVSIGNSQSEAISTWFANTITGIEGSKSSVEMLLNAFQLGMIPDLTNPSAGTLAKIKEKIHQAQFGSKHGGILWSIVTRGEGNTANSITLPETIGQQLNQLNIYQEALNTLQQSLPSLQLQLFSDWYRYLITPNPIPSHDTRQSPTATSMANYIAVETTSPPTNSFSRIHSDIKNAAKQVQTAQETLQTSLTVLGDNLILKPISAPRYWHPNEPYVLLSGNCINPRWRDNSQALTPKGYLPCQLTSQMLTQVSVVPDAGKPSVIVTASDFSSIKLASTLALPHLKAINALLEESCLFNTVFIANQTSTTNKAAIETAQKELLSTGQKNTVITAFEGTIPSMIAACWWEGSNPWLPLLFKWSTNFYPTDDVNGTPGTLTDYSKELISDNYTISPSWHLDFTYNKTSLPSNYYHYSGSSILTSHVLSALKEELGKHSSSTTLTQILEALQNAPVMGQALSGFNNALLMQQQVLQLPVAAPNPNNGHVTMDKELAPLVKTHVGNMNILAPSPNTAYNPIRAGFIDMMLTDSQFGLEVVDVFGQKRQITPNNFFVSSSLSLPSDLNATNAIALPPRITQPHRLLFRWLSANQNNQEMNSHPETTPVCGWVMPNHVDNSLMIYNAEGIMLGYFFLNGNATTIMWQSAPGNTTTINKTAKQVFEDANTHLLNFGAIFYTNPSKTQALDFFNDFMKTIYDGSTNIQPHNYKQHQALSVLIGRPLALVQSYVKLDLYGQPAYNQSWDAFENDISNQSGSNFPRTANNFTDVKFPLTLGNTKNINDGLIGYFTTKKQVTGNTTPYDFNHFYALDIKNPTTGSGVIPASSTPLKLQPHTNDASESSSLHFLMLLDPRAGIHASTGFLPTKSITIPSSQYADALEKINLVLPVTPLISNNEGSMVTVPTPIEAGYKWSWIEEINTSGTLSWSESRVTQTNGSAHTSQTEQEVKEGWLQLKPNNN